MTVSQRNCHHAPASVVGPLLPSRNLLAENESNFGVLAPGVDLPLVPPALDILPNPHWDLKSSGCASCLSCDQTEV